MSEFRTVKVGVFGAGRGKAFTSFAGEPVGLQLVALCDKNVERLDWVKSEMKSDCTLYTDFDEFLKHPDMEAVVLANAFHEHTPFAIKAMRAGKHVLSECISCSTLKEGIELCEAVEETGRIYMLAENYPYTAFNMEMKRLYDAGEIGEVMYAEGEYNHPATGEPHKGYPLIDSPMHWRLWNPTTYYCTHGIGPLMVITDTMPTSVNARAILLESNRADPSRVKDDAAVSFVKMNNGAIFRLMGTGLPGHSIWYRFHGTRGAMESVRGKGYYGPGDVRVWHEPLHLVDKLADTPTERQYTPRTQSAGASSGHGGADYWVNYYFAEAVRSGKQPYLDVYRGCAMSAVGICGWLSALEDGKEFPIPDFKDKADREKYRSFDKSPFPSVYEKEPARWIRPCASGSDDFEEYRKAAELRSNVSYLKEKR